MLHQWKSRSRPQIHQTQDNKRLLNLRKKKTTRSKASRLPKKKRRMVSKRRKKLKRRKKRRTVRPRLLKLNNKENIRSSKLKDRRKRSILRLPSRILPNMMNLLMRREIPLILSSSVTLMLVNQLFVVKS